MHFALYFSVISTLGLVGETSARLRGAIMEEERRLGIFGGNGGRNGRRNGGRNGGGNDFAPTMPTMPGDGGDYDFAPVLPPGDGGDYDFAPVPPPGDGGDYDFAPVPPPGDAPTMPTMPNDPTMPTMPGPSCPIRQGTYSGMSAVTAEGRAALNGGVPQGPGNFCESAVFEMGPSSSEGDCEVVLTKLCSSPAVGFSVYFDKCRYRKAAGTGVSFRCDGPFPESTVTGLTTDSHVEWNIRDKDGILLSSNAGTGSGMSPTMPTMP